MSYSCIASNVVSTCAQVVTFWTENRKTAEAAAVVTSQSSARPAIVWMPLIAAHADLHRCYSVPSYLIMPALFPALPLIYTKIRQFDFSWIETCAIIFILYFEELNNCGTSFRFCYTTTDVISTMLFSLGRGDMHLLSHGQVFVVTSKTWLPCFLGGDENPKFLESAWIRVNSIRAYKECMFDSTM